MKQKTMMFLMILQITFLYFVHKIFWHERGNFWTFLSNIFVLVVVAFTGNFLALLPWGGLAIGVIFFKTKAPSTCLLYSVFPSDNKIGPNAIYSMFAAAIPSLSYLHTWFPYHHAVSMSSQFRSQEVYCLLIVPIIVPIILRYKNWGLKVVITPTGHCPH